MECIKEPLVQTTKQKILTVDQAISLIGGASFNLNTPQKWADLGCGSGLFSHSLASLLPDGSHILAVDKAQQNLSKSSPNEVQIEFLQADFIKDDIPITGFDGILMANSLHYVKGQKSFIRNLKSQLDSNAKFIIIEYDIEHSTPWVPYPIPFTKLTNLFTSVGYSNIQKIGERASRYGRKNIYACEVKP